MNAPILENSKSRFPWRPLAWSVPVVLLSIPLLGQWPWTLSDFVFAAVLFGLVGGTIELAVRASRSHAYRGGAALAVLAAFLLIWINGAVGIIGNENNPANLVFFAIILLALIGSVVVRARAAGMSRVMMLAAGAQGLVAIFGLVRGLGAGDPPGAFGLLVLNGFFVGLFAGSAWLFGIAARTTG